MISKMENRYQHKKWKSYCYGNDSTSLNERLPVAQLHGHSK